MKINLIFLIACVVSETFKLELLEQSSSKLTNLSDTLTLKLESELASNASVSELINKIKQSKIPSIFTLYLISESLNFATTFEVKEKYKSPTLNFEVLTDDENNILNISVLIGNDQKQSVSISIKKITNLDFQAIDPSAFKLKMTPKMPPSAASNRHTGEPVNNDVPPPPIVEEEQTFFKKYFWYIVIGGMIAFNLFTADTNKLKNAYNQAQEAAAVPVPK